MTYSDTNWCISCWKDFVTLTYEEQRILDLLKMGLSKEQISKYISKKKTDKPRKTGRPRKLCKIKIIETGAIYYSISECAKYLDVDRQQVYSALKLKYKLKKKYTLEKIA